MGLRAVRPLVLVCSLLLAMPQGWCCILASYMPKATGTAASGTKSLAGCCPCQPLQSDPSDTPTPAEKPSAPTNTICPCADRHATLPDAPSVEQVDAGFVLFLPPLSLVAPGIEHRAAVAGADLPPPTPPLHVLHCVWLC